MGFWQFLAIQQTVEGAVFAILAVAGILAHRRWGLRASAIVVILAFPIFVATALLNELMRAPQLWELNSFAQLFRVSLRTPAMIATVGLAVALWLARRVGTLRRSLTWGAVLGAVWAYVMPVPLVILSLAWMYVVPMGTAEYYYVDLRPMGLEVLEVAKPNFHHYEGEAIPLRYRAQLDGREIEVYVEPAESTSAHFNVRAVSPASPLFVVDGTPTLQCGFTTVIERVNVISTDWSAGPQAWQACYQATGEAAITIGFVGSDSRLTLHGPVVKAGDYWFYDSL